MFLLDGVALNCETISPIIKFVKFLLQCIQWLVPIIIIILGSLDLFKAVIASKEDEIKNAQKLLIKRVIYGVAIFFVTILVTFIFNALGSTGTSTGEAGFLSCWNEV